jgi:hypothetical protein
MALGVAVDAFYRRIIATSRADLWEAILCGLAGLALLWIFRFAWALITVPAQIDADLRAELDGLKAERAALSARERNMTAAEVLTYLPSRTTDGKGCSVRTIEVDLQQAAVDGKITVWGKRLPKGQSSLVPTIGAYEIIPASFFALNPIRLKDGEVGRRDPWSGLVNSGSFLAPMFCRAQVEALWPRS